MLELLSAADFRGQVQDLLLVALCVVAIGWGSAPERTAIAVWVICLEVPTLIIRNVLTLDYALSDVDLFLAVMDVAAGAFWTALALYANRNYTLWIAGAQLLAISSHVARGLVESISPIGYIFLVVAPGWIILLIMLIGFTRHILRKRTYGEYRDWRIIRNSNGLPSPGPGAASPSSARFDFRKGFDE